MAVLGCREDRVQQHFTDMIHSPSLRAPEVLLGAGWDSRCDIWSVGCMVSVRN